MKTLYIALGTLSLALGILGIFLPLLPTTPFLLLTAALYFKSSPRLYNWLLNQKHLGPYIRNFRENKAINGTGNRWHKTMSQHLFSRFAFGLCAVQEAKPAPTARAMINVTFFILLLLFIFIAIPT